MIVWEGVLINGKRGNGLIFFWRNGTVCGSWLCIVFACKTDAMGKAKKTSYKISKHLVQQVVHNLRDVFLL